jgi:hypothetical protein
MLGQLDKQHSPRSSKKPKGGEFTFILFVVGFILFLMQSKWLYYESLSASWPSTEGVIIEHNVEVLSKRRYGKEILSYKANIIYAYEVKGQQYKDDRVTMPYYVEDTPEALESYFKAYPIGKAVIVHYDPWRPKTAILEPVTISLRTVLFLIFSFFFMGIGLLRVFLSRSKV